MEKKDKDIALLKKCFRNCRSEMKADALRYIEQYVKEYNYHNLNLQKLAQQLEHKSLETILYKNTEGFRNIKDMKNTAVVVSYAKYTGGSVVSAAKKMLLEKNPELKEFHGRQKKYFTIQFNKLYNVFLQSLESEVRYIFENTIQDNKNYQKIYDKLFLEKQRIESMMLDQIPDRIPDLYPLARQMQRHFILHVGPTNSGKTYDALQAMKKAERAIYLAPLRLLAYEIYDRLNGENVPCNMITGEEEIVIEDAEHYSATIETLNVKDYFDVAVIDEGQMIADRKRGSAWTRAILGVCADEIHVCSDDSCVELIKKIIEECQDTYEIRYNQRMVPLEMDQKEFIFPSSVKEKDALIVFSKRSVIAVTAELQKAGIAASMIYGNLPYDVRMNEVRRFTEGETKVVVATDAIGMGLNLPIKRIVFLETKKFDGDIVRPLTTSEIKQIAGRAGRRGQFEVGYYNSEFRKKSINKAVLSPLPPVETAKLNVPESIINLNMPLSDILRRWMEIANDDIYEKADLSEDITLCRALEQHVNDKSILYSLITLGCRGSKKELTEILIQFGMIEENGGEEKNRLIQNVLDANIIPHKEELELLNMEELEDLYFKYDLMYAYLRKFAHRKWMPEIIALKRDCSARIIELLQTQTLETRKCRTCGCDLTWNYPYMNCLDCYIKSGR